MNAFALVMALAGLAVVIGAYVAYFRTIPRGTVPVRLGGWKLMQGVGIVLAVLAIISGVSGDGSAGFAVFVPAVLALVLGLAFYWLLSQRKTPIGDLKVKVGDKLLPFSATTSEGAAFHTDELVGKRTLLKFFRGGWCPYCSAEIKSLDTMQPDLDKMGVKVIALSKDPVDEAAIHKTRDGLSLTLLADPELDVIRQYGVEHHKALGQNKNPTTLVGGIPFGLSPFSFKTMAIPTTLLIDENRVIQWIDQTDDYRLRSSNARVLDAVKGAFG